MTPAPAWIPPGPALLFCPADRPERYGKAADRADV
ncbi:CoA ester lyase, partial [Dietzia sp. SLG510A3-3B2-2]|nr:CoA ester lyase [Dietzia sp. SLG510A3-3B2-2]